MNNKKIAIFTNFLGYVLAAYEEQDDTGENSQVQQQGNYINMQFSIYLPKDRYGEAITPIYLK